MHRQRSLLWPIVTAIIAAACLLISLPDSWKEWLPDSLKPELHLGLDLAGGTQLDFRISEDEISELESKLKDEIRSLQDSGGGSELLQKQLELQSVEQQHTNLVEAIRVVLERRINSLGVSEATITPSYFGTEKHLLVECPGVIDVDKCIATVGKTIQLEFKEEYTGSSDEYQQKIRAKAEEAYRRVKSATGSLQVVGQDLIDELGVAYADAQPYFLSELTPGLKEMWRRRVKDPVLKTEGTIQVIGQNDQGAQELKDIRGIYLSQVVADPKPITRELKDPAQALEELSKSTRNARFRHSVTVNASSLDPALRQIVTSIPIGTQQLLTYGPSDVSVVYLAGRTEGEEQMTASHILISYQGASQADESVTRTKQEALLKGTEIRERLDRGESFNALASSESDGPSKEKAGSLGVLRRGTMVPAFESAAFALKTGEMSDVIETPFGYHIIRADVAAHTTDTKVTTDELKITDAKASEIAAGILKQVQEGTVSRTEDQIVLRTIFFSLEPTGWKDTQLNGQRFRSASVTTDPVTNAPVVQIQFDEEGAKLFQELTKRNIDKRIAIFVGGEMVSAPTVQQEISGGTAVITGSQNIAEAQRLAQDLNTGAIPAPIYLSGQATIEATLGANALRQSIMAGFVGLLVLGLFMVLIYRFMGLMANLALIFYVVLLITLTKLPLLLITNQYVVLTLAGIAGIILSMGMAVDANVLAFERIKEEVKRGKLLKTAIDTGFKRAWPSVRDGNVSTLITCAILFIIGTSIIRGFAITLSIGIFTSLFTALIVSHWLVRWLTTTAIAERPELFGVPPGSSHEQLAPSKLTIDH